jgi:hypothetical protein
MVYVVWRVASYTHDKNAMISNVDEDSFKTGKKEVYIFLYRSL